MNGKTENRTKRKYTMSDKARTARKLCGIAARGGRPVRVWKSMKISSDVMEYIDKRRGEKSRNTFLSDLLKKSFQATS